MGKGKDAEARDAEQVPVPVTVRVAGGLVALEGLFGLVVAVVLGVRAARGTGRVAEGVGTAAWFVIAGGAVLAAGVGLLWGRRAGRAIALLAQVLLGPSAWFVFTDSRVPGLGAVMLIVAVVVVISLLAPATSRWMAAGYG